MNTLIKTVSICLLGLILANVKAEEKETVIDLSKVPAAIQQAAKQKVPGIELICAKSSVRKKGLLYEIKGKSKRKGYEMKFDQAGKLVDFEMSSKIPLRISEIPGTVKTAVEKQVKNLVITEAELKMKGKAIYLLEGTASGKQYEIAVTKDGDILKLEGKNEDDNEHEGEDNENNDGNDDND